MQGQPGAVGGTGFSGAAVAAVLLVLGASSPALANRPSFAGSGAPSPGAAVRFSDPSVSRVIYYELTADAPVQWFAVESDRPQELRVQLGVPVGPSQVAGEPALALFGPGLDGRLEGVAIEPPPGTSRGGLAVSANGQPEEFYEPVTGTRSVIVGEARVQLPSAGTYYGAVFDVRGQEGKLWVALGEREVFTWRDLPRLFQWIRKARAFHELSGWPRWMGVAGGGILALAVTAAVLVRRLAG